MNSNPNRLYIDAKAVEHNYQQLKAKVGPKVKIVPVLKANAYGCGLKEIISLFENLDYFAVGNIREAGELKTLSPKSDVLLIYQSLITDIETIVINDYISAVSDYFFALALNQSALKHHKKIRVHLEIDTGMSRFGIKFDEVESFATKIKRLDNIIVEGVFMHYAVANSLKASDLAFTKRQTALFKEAVKKVEAILGSVKYIHACSGAAVFNPETEIFNMIRPGYILYGYYGDSAFKTRVKLKPALKLVAKIISVTKYEKGVTIGYLRKFMTKRRSQIATISIGYADGLPRGLSNVESNPQTFVVINQQRVPIAGIICMDITMLDVTGIKGEIKPGDDVYIFDNEKVTLEEHAAKLDTSGYEVITRISANVQKKLL